jgi:hypothetical protein
MEGEIMASDFQRAKVAGVFDAMDANGDGFLEEADFHALTDRWIGIRGCTPGSEDHSRLTSIMMGWWAALLAASDTNRDNKITLEEVLRVVDQLGAMTSTVNETAHAMFEAIDADADDRISPAEYRQLIETWNGRETNTDEIFPLLDLDADGYVTKAEFAELWREFWAGDDQESPGTLVFGGLTS